MLYCNVKVKNLQISKTLIMNNLKALILLLFSACADKAQNISDAGESIINKNNASWNCIINTSTSPRYPGEFNIRFTNEFEPDPPFGKFNISNLPFEEGEYFPIKYDSSNPREIHSGYQNRFPGDSTPESEWDLLEDYEDLRFELTHVSKDKQNVEGFMNLAYVPRLTSTPSRFGEPDTIIFIGTFEAEIPK